MRFRFAWQWGEGDGGRKRRTAVLVLVREQAEGHGHGLGPPRALDADPVRADLGDGQDLTLAAAQEHRGADCEASSLDGRGRHRLAIVLNHGLGAHGLHLRGVRRRSPRLHEVPSQRVLLGNVVQELVRDRPQRAELRAALRLLAMNERDEADLHVRNHADLVRGAQASHFRQPLLGGTDVRHSLADQCLLGARHLLGVAARDEL
eukprot:9495316-Pyramimonas_sp.AAC.1